jgi:hypothetical protein
MTKDANNAARGLKAAAGAEKQEICVYYQCCAFDNKLFHGLLEKNLSRNI